MAKLKNVSSLGDVDLPLVGRIVKAGEEFDVPAHIAAQLLEQPDNFITVVKPASKPRTPKSTTATTKEIS